MSGVKFGIFDHLEDIPGTPTHQIFKDRLDLIRTADQAGFWGYHLAEHHGGGLCLAPSQEIFIGAASQVTENIRMGPMVKLLPMRHPVRIVEDMCIIDQLTEGRLEFGVGRGPVPVEHYWFGDTWEGARERMVDTLGIIHRALRTGEVSSEGSRFHDFPPMPMAPKPFQERIPFWYPGSPQTAGEYGMSLMWPGKISEEAYEQYLEAWEAHKGGPIRMEGPDDRPRVGYSMLLAIAPTEREARQIAERGMNGLVRRTELTHQFDLLVVSEQEAYQAQGPLRAIQANMHLAIQFGAGTPGQIAERVAGLLEDGMCDYICFMFPAGDMTIDESRRTLELFVTEVQPQLTQTVGG